MIKIAPSILAADFCRLGEDIASVREGDMLHFDVMDGSFVPNISFGIPVLKSVRAFTDMTLDVHLMIHDPVRYVERFAAAGADILSVHLEADTHQGTAQALDEMERCGVKRALALRPISAPEAILPYVDRLDMVLVMTVEPGFGAHREPAGDGAPGPDAAGPVQSRLRPGGGRRRHARKRRAGEGRGSQRAGGGQRHLRAGGQIRRHPDAAGGIIC